MGACYRAILIMSVAIPKNMIVGSCEMKVFYCRAGWMKYYKGYIDNDRPVNGGKYNESNIGHVL